MSDTSFKGQIREKIADSNLQSALDANVERRMAGRAAALASVPDWAERRQRAHAIRARVIEHLEDYLEEFIANAERNGIRVHRAKDAAEAVKIVLEIAEKVPGVENLPIFDIPTSGDVGVHGKLFAKSKSMVSEEIELNHALEAAGHRVVETDLGEYIIQLRHERPSHIITPAVHLRRADVGILFQEKLGIPYTEDIPTLTNTARKILREVFLTADIGLSGVNFGVAETGTFTLVTNEGNGRMVTTLPPVHIALMGMERIVPSLDDLSLFLSLLPRSATGQKLSVYTSLIQRSLEGQQRHLVIVDNGRSALRQSPLKESLYCIRCGACLNACPVFREMGGHAYRGADGAIAPYPGPIGSVVSPGLMGENFAQLAQASSLCGACKEACPVDIDLPKMLLRIRAGEIPSENRKPLEGQGLPGILKLALGGFARIASHPRLFAVLQKIAGWFSRPLPRFLPTPAFTGWGYSKDFPKPVKPFRERFRGISQQTAEKPAQTERGLSVETLQPPQPDQISLAEQFTFELTALGGQVIACAEGDLGQKVAAFLRERGIQSVCAGAEAARLLQNELSEVLVLPYPYESTPAGITFCPLGYAPAGSVLVSGADQAALTASLLPEIHIALLRARDLTDDLTPLLRLGAESPASVIVTGPSRTADIEMTLTIGVHGPKELVVFLLS
jgi:L-lactate dehydrogenase complex protein LldF